MGDSKHASNDHLDTACIQSIPYLIISAEPPHSMQLNMSLSRVSFRRAALLPNPLPLARALPLLTRPNTTIPSFPRSAISRRWNSSKSLDEGGIRDIETKESLELEKALPDLDVSCTQRFRGVLRSPGESGVSIVSPSSPVDQDFHKAPQSSLTLAFIAQHFNLQASTLSVHQSSKPSSPLPDDSLVFGKTFTDHMLTISWNEKTGWGKGEIGACE